MASDLAWAGFAALLFLFMGLGLALEPDAYAQSAVDWALEGGRSAREARRLSTGLCRACGAGFLAAAAWLAAIAFGVPVWGAARVSALAVSPRARLLAGLGATLVSLAVSTMKMSEWAAPRRRTALAHVSFWSGWGVVFTLMAFGAFALSRARLLQ